MFLRAVVSGIAIGAGFVLPYLWPVSFAGVAALLFIIVQARGVKQAILLAYITGFVSWLFALAAIFLGVLPLDWYGITNGLIQTFLVSISLILAAAIAASGFALAAIAFRLLYSNTWRDAIVLPFAWVLSEYIGTIWSYVVWLGSGSYFGPHFSIGWVGYLLASDKVLLQTASVGGVFVMSFIVMFVGVLIFKIVHNKNSRTKTAYSAVLGMCVVCWLCLHILISNKSILQQTHNASHKTLSVGVVSRQRPPLLTISQANEKKYIEEVYNIIKPLRDIDLLVLSEETAFFKSLNLLDGDVPVTLNSIGRNGHTPVIIDSNKVINNYGQSLSEVSYYRDGKSIANGHKQFLLPLGEYLPNLYIAIMRLLGAGDLVGVVQSVRGYVPGELPVIGEVGGAIVSTRFCAESMSPTLYNDNVVNGAEILVNISSFSWFHGSKLVYMQMQRIAKVRAVESGRWFVQSGNKAPAFVLNQYGEVVAETETDKVAVLQLDVPALTKHTLYTKLRLWMSGI